MENLQILIINGLILLIIGGSGIVTIYQAVFTINMDIYISSSRSHSSGRTIDLLEKYPIHRARQIKTIYGVVKVISAIGLCILVLVLAK